MPTILQSPRNSATTVHARQTVCVGMDPASAVIGLARITGEGALADLARQALGKASRGGQPLAEMYLVHGDDRGRRSLPSLHGSRTVSASDVLPLLRRHRATGRLFVPASHAVSPELALYALASGLSADALRLDPAPSTAPLHGTLFLRALRLRD